MLASQGSEEERELLITAGAEMACSGCNDKALNYFGVKYIHKRSWRGSLANISQCGLPLFTSPTQVEMEQNQNIINGIFARQSEKIHSRRFVLCFDRTYLTACTQLATTSRGQVLLGGAFRPEGFEQPDESQQIIKNSEGNLTNLELHRHRTRATEMESLVLWDPTLKFGPVMEFAAFPVTSAAAKDSRFESLARDPRYRGNWQTLMTVGQALLAGENIKFIIADAHGAHKWLSMWYGRCYHGLTRLPSWMFPYVASGLVQELLSMKGSQSISYMDHVIARKTSPSNFAVGWAAYTSAIVGATKPEACS